jgi:ribose transport system ATP-binding protein
MFPPPLRSRTARKPEELIVQGVSGGELRNVHFTARSGEVVGLAGLEGAGVSTEAARRGVCLVPADRRRNGLMLDRSILFNVSQVVVGALSTSSLFNLPEARNRASRQIARLRIKTRSPDTFVNHLSGGNQQKVVIGKWLEIEPRVVLLDDPARGVDIGAKREIYELIRRMSADGCIVLFSSTELPELIGLCDRILVLYRGRLAGEVAGSGIDNRTLLHLINTGERPPQTSSAPL